MEKEHQTNPKRLHEKQMGIDSRKPQGKVNNLKSLSTVEI